MPKKEETYSLYLRFVWMFIDLSTETVLCLFRHLIKSNDISAFLTSREIKQQIEELKRKKVLHITEYKKVTTEKPDQYDLSLLITLIRNMIPENELPPPKKGWNYPPRRSDKSLAADLLRLRKIRNVIVAHSAKVYLENKRFDQYWAEVTGILIKVQTEISTQELKGREKEEFEQEFKRRIEDYRVKAFEPCQTRIEDLINEWRGTFLEIQAQTDKLLKGIADIDRYFKSQSQHRFDQYICLLDKGGKFVLSSYLKLKIDESCSDFKERLRQKESSIRKVIKDTKQLASLFIQNTPSSENMEKVLQSLNISSLAVLILYMFSNDDELIRREIKDIQSAHENYAVKLVATDTDDTFSDVLSDLKASLKFISKFLLKEQKNRIYDIIEECKKKTNQRGSYAECENNLKSQGITSLKDLYKDIKEKTDSVLKTMTNEGIPFRSEKVLELKMITCGTSEEKTRLAEKIIVEVWREALERTDNQESFTPVEEEVHKILKEIRKDKGITGIKIERKCILLSVASKSPIAFLDIIEYFESETFRETVSIISQELGYHFGTVFRTQSCLTIESMNGILDYQNIVHEEKANRLRLLVGVSSPKSMMRLQSFFRSEQVSNSKKRIAESLSNRFNDKMQCDISMDGLLAVEFFEEGGTSPSSEENSDSDQPLEGDMTDNLDETITEDENKLLVTEVKLVVEENKITERAKSVKDVKLIESDIIKDALEQGKQKMMETRSSHDGLGVFYRRRRRDCADTADSDHDKAYKTLFLHGILLDMSCMNVKQKSTSIESQRQFILSQIKVLVDAVKFDVCRFNRIFVTAVGGSQGSGTFDIIGTLQSEVIRRFDQVSDETMESLFKYFEENGAGITRKWVDKKILKQTVLEREAKLILNNLKSDRDFSRRFFTDILHVSCQDWGVFGVFIQQMYAWVVSFYRQATAQEIREVVNRSMTSTEESLLMEIKNHSVYKIYDASLSFFGSDGKEDMHTRHQGILESLDPFIYGEKKLHSSLNDVCRVFKTSVSVQPNHQRILFVISDGCSSEKIDVEIINRQLEEANVTVVCFFPSFSMTEDQKAYDGTEDSHEDGERILIELCSTFPQDPLSRAIFLQRGIDVREENAKMFFNVKDSGSLKELCDFVRKALSCWDSLFDLIPCVSLDIFINLASSKNADRDFRKQSFAMAVSTSIRLSIHRICSDVDGYPDIRDLLDEVINNLEKGKQNMPLVLQNIFATYHLHYRSVDITGAMKGVAAKRSVIATFHLTDEELVTFTRFYEEKPFGILTSDAIPLHERLPNAILTEHSVLLTSFNNEYLRFMNFWGDTWADKGFFRVENAEVLKIEFIEVYWKDEKMIVNKSIRQNEIIENFERELTKLQTKQVLCSSCKSNTKSLTLRGILPLAECPLCKQMTEDDKTLFALQTYIASLIR